MQLKHCLLIDGVGTIVCTLIFPRITAQQKSPTRRAPHRRAPSPFMRVSALVGPSHWHQREFCSAVVTRKINAGLI